MQILCVFISQNTQVSRLSLWLGQELMFPHPQNIALDDTIKYTSAILGETSRGTSY